MSRDDLARIPPAERVLLAQELLDSVLLLPQDDDLSAEQAAELRRRMSAIDSGEATCERWETVLLRLLRR